MKENWVSSSSSCVMTFRIAVSMGWHSLARWGVRMLNSALLVPFLV